MRAHVDQSSLFGYYSPATGEVTSHPPLCACGACSMPVETFSIDRLADETGPRHFYRCADCLTVVTTDAEVKGYNDGYTRRLGTCGGCGGFVEYMGRTERDRLVKTEQHCPCDARCTGARGPSCDCQCGGKNHGSNLWVMVTVDAGGIPVLGTPGGASTTMLAEQYRGLVKQVRAAIEETYGAVIARKCEGQYLTSEEYGCYLKGTRLKRELWAAEAMRTHAGRNKKLAQLLKAAKGEN